MCSSTSFPKWNKPLQPAPGLRPAPQEPPLLPLSSHSLLEGTHYLTSNITKSSFACFCTLCKWLITLSILCLRLIHTVVCGYPSFLSLLSEFQCIWTVSSWWLFETVLLWAYLYVCVIRSSFLSLSFFSVLSKFAVTTMAWCRAHNKCFMNACDRSRGRRTGTKAEKQLMLGLGI